MPFSPCDAFITFITDNIYYYWYRHYAIYAMPYAADYAITPFSYAFLSLFIVAWLLLISLIFYAALILPLIIDYCRFYWLSDWCLLLWLLFINILRHYICCYLPFIYYILYFFISFIYALFMIDLLHYISFLITIFSAIIWYLSFIIFIINIVYIITIAILLALIITLRLFSLIFSYDYLSLIISASCCVIIDYFYTFIDITLFYYLIFHYFITLIHFFLGLAILPYFIVAIMPLQPYWCFTLSSFISDLFLLLFSTFFFALIDYFLTLIIIHPLLLRHFTYFHLYCHCYITFIMAIEPLHYIIAIIYCWLLRLSYYYYYYAIIILLRLWPLLLLIDDIAAYIYWVVDYFLFIAIFIYIILLFLFWYMPLLPLHICITPLHAIIARWHFYFQISLRHYDARVFA